MNCFFLGFFKNQNTFCTGCFILKIGSILDTAPVSDFLPHSTSSVPLDAARVKNCPRPELAANVPGENLGLEVKITQIRAHQKHEKKHYDVQNDVLCGVA